MNPDSRLLPRISDSNPKNSSVFPGILGGARRIFTGFAQSNAILILQKKNGIWVLYDKGNTTTMNPSQHGAVKTKGSVQTMQHKCFAWAMSMAMAAAIACTGCTSSDTNSSADSGTSTQITTAASDTSAKETDSKKNTASAESLSTLQDNVTADTYDGDLNEDGFGTGGAISGGTSVTANGGSDGMSGGFGGGMPAGDPPSGTPGGNFGKNAQRS